MTTFILPFDSSDATLAMVGGKGANLSRLTRAGFPVPPGFLITTTAYHAFVQANHLHSQIVTLASDKAKTVDEASTAIRRLFEQGCIPPEVAVVIQPAYAELMRIISEASSLAVRSSATAEDLPEASFAGQQESYLNVRGDSALLEAIKQCWSSLWTARALDYRARQNIDPSGVSLSVVVQMMVPAEAAGILFTANPLSGAQDEIVLDAAWGLGEAIVGGLVTPDHIVADKVTSAIKQIAIGDKAVMTVPTATGTEEREVGESQRRAQVLSAAQVAELAKLGATIESHYGGAPQDIEWCWANGRFYVVQARPITTLPPEPVRWASPILGAKWMKDVLAAEWAKEPPSPLGATTTFATMATAREQTRIWPPPPKHRLPWFTLINGWLYMRADHDLLPMIGVMAGMMTAICQSFLTGSPNGHKRAQRTWPQRVAKLDELERLDLTTISDDALHAHTDRLLGELAWWWMEFVWFNGVARTSAQVMGPMRIPGVPDPTALFRGNDSLLLEAARALRHAADDPSKVEAYLTQFGNASESADPIHPTLRESPELLAWQLATARRNDSGPDERLARSLRERAKAEAAICALKGLRGILLRNALAVGQNHAAHTDNAVFHFQRVLASLRATFLEEVLIAHATSPIWTPLFGIASAAVTEVGGQFAHAAIVAREFGIPLVDGALDATRVIADGMPVVVDGSAGIVEL